MLLHFGLVTFRIHFGYPHLFGFGGRVHDTKTNIISVETPGYSNNSRKTNHFPNISFLEITKVRGIIKFENLGKDGDQEIPKICLIKLKTLDMGSLSSKQMKWKTLKILNMDQYLSKNMEWKFGNMESISSQKHGINILVSSIKGT